MVPASGRSAARRVLWVEGKDDSAVAQGLCEAHAVPEIFRVQAKSGVDELLNNFFAELRAPGAERFGVVVDADGSAEARWASIRNTLVREGYAAVPDQLEPNGVIVPGTRHRPLFGAWIMPDNGSPGAIEEFAASLVPHDDDLWRLAQSATDSIPAEQRLFPDVHRAKAYIHTWLAWQRNPGSPMGQAIGQGALRAEAPAAQRFVDWLRRLMVEDANETPA